MIDDGDVSMIDKPAGARWRACHLGGSRRNSGGTPARESSVPSSRGNQDTRATFPCAPSALSQLKFRIHGLQFAPCVFGFHLPINASLRCVNIS